jgi:capsular exopolysaccharide synthesis family protein
MMSSSPPAPSHDKSSLLRFDLSDVQEILRRRWKLLTCGLLVGWALGAAYYATATVKYESKAQILVMRKDPRMTSTRGDNSDHTEASVTEDLLSTHMQILQSPEIVGTALKEGKFDELPSIVEALGKDETPTDFIINRLDVTRGGTGQSRLAHVLNISLRHTNENETKAILEGIIANYRKFLGVKFQDVSQEAALLISRAKIELAGELREAEAAYRAFRENAPMLYNGTESANVHRVRYEELQSAISSSRLKTSTAKARLEVVEQAIKDQDARGASDVERLALLDEQDVERLTMLVNVEKGDANTAEFQSNQPQRLEMARAQHESYMKLLMEEKSKAADLGDDHPHMQMVRNQIATAQAFFNDQLQRLGDVEKRPKVTPKVIVEAYRELLRQDLRTLEKQQAALEATATLEAEEAKKLVRDELKGEALRKEVERVQDLLDAVLERLREINLVKDYAGFITEVIAPVEAGEKVSPKLWLAIIGGTMLGLMFGGLAAGAVELQDRSLHTLQSLRAIVKLPVLATIPRLAEQLDEKDLAAAEDGERSSRLVTYFKPRSRESEIFRGLRTSLFFAARNGKSQLIACSSPTMGDGKSTVLANVAVSMAQSGKRVLLVDCDMRRPSVHQVFHLPNNHGLTDVIGGTMDLPDAAHTMDVENLTVLTCGRLPLNPAELLASAEFEQFLEHVREQYDFVLLDCPPVLAVSDPCIVAIKTDFVMLVVNLENNNRPQVVRAEAMLSELNAQTLGIIVNGLDEQRTASDRYGYGYGYGYGDQRSRKYYVEGDESLPKVALAERASRTMSAPTVEEPHARNGHALHD